MKQFYLFLAHHQRKIKNLFLLSYIILIVLFILGIWNYQNTPEIRSLYRELAKRFGQLSVGLLIITLIPGMLKRIGILDKLESLFALFRRQLGVLAFYTAVMHLGYVSWIKKIAMGQNPLPTAFTYQQTGFAALAIFLLLWVTSNDFSMDFFGKWWKYIQRLAYLSVIALILHIYDAESKIWILLTGILFLEALSWIIYFVKIKVSSADPTLPKNRM